MAEDIEKLTDWARSQGFIVTYSANGYRHFHTASGEHVGYYPKTPSRPRRRLARLILDLRRAGLPWPPRSKKEQRAQRRRNQEES